MPINVFSQRRVARFLTVTLLVSCATMSLADTAGIAAQWNPTPGDKMRLPQYCWAQFDKVFAEQTKTKMPIQICGSEMNHFCPALIMLNRAQYSTESPNARKDYMREALGGLKYTYRNLPPNCPLKPDIDAAQARADFVARILPKGTR